MRRISIVLLVALLAGCGGDDHSGPAVPDGAKELQAFVREGVFRLTPGLGRFDALLPFLSNPGSPGASGITFGHDPAPGAPPNAWVFDIPLDADADGTLETTITGRALLNGDPAHPAVGFGGSIDLTVESVGGLGDFEGDLDFEIKAEGTELSGTGTFTDAASSDTTSMTVDPDHPLLVKVATGGTGAVANACAYSLGGDVDVNVTGPTGLLGMLWQFTLNQAAVHVTHATYRDPDGVETQLGDAEVAIPCNGGALSDWTGVFLQDYSCLSPEYGQARLTLSVAGPNRIRIVDEDPPGSGETDTYEATVVGGNPHVVRGFFIGGPPGTTYREDFNWTLSENGQSFSQVSVYQFQEGPNTGNGGLCSGRATRESSR